MEILVAYGVRPLNECLLCRYREVLIMVARAGRY